MKALKTFGKIVLIPILAVAALFAGCSSNKNPTAPPVPATSTFTPTITNSPTITPTPLLVRWSAASVTRTNILGTVSQYAQLDLSVGSQAVTNAVVFLSGSNIGTPVTLAYNSSATFTGVPYAIYTQNGTGWTYQAGQTYILNTVTAAGTASATLVAPGGISFAANASSVTWGVAGGEDSVVVNLGATTTYSSATGGPLTSPYSIPATAYAAYGTYNVTVGTLNQLFSIPGIISGNYAVGDTNEQSFTFAAPTDTPTITPSITPTPTITRTPTNSPTLTPTESFTNTPSGTFTIPPTATATNSPTTTPTDSPTVTPTSTPTDSPTNSPTVTITSTPTQTPTITSTPTNTPTGPHWRYAGNPGVANGNPANLFFSSGTVYLGYESNVGAGVNLTSWSGSSWGAPESGSVYPYLPSYFVDNGAPYVAFADSINQDYATVMEYTAGSWQYVGSAAFSPWRTNDISLYVYDNGATIIPYVAFNDNSGDYTPASTYQTTVMEYISGTNSWVTVGAPDFSLGYADWENLQVDSTGTPYLCYSDDSTGSRNVSVMKYTGSGPTSWTAVGSANFATANSQYPSFAIDGTTLYVAFSDTSTSSPPGQPSVMKSTGGAWSYVGTAGMGLTGVQGFWNSLYIYNHNPWVAFEDWYDTSDRASVMYYNGSSWAPEGSAHFTPGQADHMSLIVNGSGVPYVSFTDYTQKAGGYNASSVMYYQ